MKHMMQLSNLCQFASGMTNIPKCMHFIMTAEIEVLNWMVGVWRGHELLSIIKWEIDDHWDWALRIDLGPLDKPGQEAILPFGWNKNLNKPMLLEGVLAWRHYAATKGESICT